MGKIVVRRRQLPASAIGNGEEGAAAPRLPSGLHPVLRRAYAARDVTSPRDLEFSLARLHPFEQLSGCQQAAGLLQEMLVQGRRILIVGDFDADGATSCALAVRALRAMGAGQVDYLVPNRFEYGYGLTPEIVAEARSYGPALIVTVDNGISSIEGVAAARSAGIKVLITDHHLPGAVLPDADGIVNPNQANDPFPSKHLAGVGVIFYVMLALRARLRAAGWFGEQGPPEPNLADLLDLVALGTIADVVTLDHNNRILVAQGLARIRRGVCCPGIQALTEVAGRDPTRLVAADLGYALGPRLNAAGRLEDMSLGIECLLCGDPAAAREMAARLDELNQERRRIESEMRAQAIEHLGDLALEEADLPGVSLCLYHEEWHQGVIGILASRLKDRLHRPVIVFAPAREDELKGSARSVSGLHIRDALDAVAARYPGLIRKFGGHAMAAGLSLHPAKFEAFKDAFEEEVRRHLDPEALHGVIYSDGELGPDELSLQVAELVRAAGPWGQGFPEPVFDGCFHVKRRRVVGERHLKLQLSLPGSARLVDAIAFNAAEQGYPEADEIHIAYRLDVNDYGGRCSPQLIVEHILN